MIVTAICLTISTILFLIMCAIVYFRCFEDEHEEFYELPFTGATNSIRLQSIQISVSSNESNPKSAAESAPVPIKLTSERIPG